MTAHGAAGVVAVAGPAAAQTRPQTFAPVPSNVMDPSRTVLAQGARDGWYLVTAGDGHSATLAQVLDTHAGVIHPPQHADAGAGRCWRPHTGDPAPVLAAAAAATAADRPPVLAHQGDHRYLLAAGLDGYGLELAQILDLTTGRLFSPSAAESAIRHGGWEPFDGDPDAVLAAAAAAAAALPPPPPRRPPGRMARVVTADRLADRAAQIGSDNLRRVQTNRSPSGHGPRGFRLAPRTGDAPERWRRWCIRTSSTLPISWPALMKVSISCRPIPRRRNAMATSRSWR